MPKGAGEPTVVLLAMPAPWAVPTTFVQSVLQMTLDPELRIYPFLPSGTVIHLARDESIKLARRLEDVEYLCFLDTDQVVDRLVLRRLVRWCETRPEVHAVAPVIVQRNGDPTPVCYHEVGQDAGGVYRYQELSEHVYAYLSQFEEHWWTSAPSGVLPLEPRHPSPIENLPPEVAAGLRDPLLKVHAVGAGMVLVRRDAFLAMEPDPQTGLFCSFQQGGEDFELMRRLRASGYDGIYVDRGCWVGHMTNYSRGIADMAELVLSRNEERSREAEADAKLPRAVPDLLNDLPRAPAPWDRVELPEAVPV